MNPILAWLIFLPVYVLIAFMTVNNFLQGVYGVSQLLVGLAIGLLVCGYAHSMSSAKKMKSNTKNPVEISFLLIFVLVQSVLPFLPNDFQTYFGAGVSILFLVVGFYMMVSYIFD